MIRVSRIVGGRVELALSGTEAEVRWAVHDFFEAFDPYAYDSRMTKATYDGKGGLTVLLVRNLDFHPRYRRDYASEGPVVRHHRNSSLDP